MREFSESLAVWSCVALAAWLASSPVPFLLLVGLLGFALGLALFTYGLSL